MTITETLATRKPLSTFWASFWIGCFCGSVWAYAAWAIYLLVRG